MIGKGSKSSRGRTGRSKLLVWVVFLVGVLLYLPTLKHGFFWDDDAFFVENEYVKNFDVGKIFIATTY